MVQYVMGNKEVDYLYYTAPIELIRGFLEHPLKCLEYVLYYQIARFDTIDKTEGILVKKWGNKSRAMAICKQLHSEDESYSRVTISVSHNIFWDYYANVNRKTEFDLLIFLAYHALKSMIGGKNGKRRKVIRSSYGEMFARMAGYKSMRDLQECGGIAEDDPMWKYMKCERSMSYIGKRLRDELMVRFCGFHTYSAPKKRGFLFMFNTKQSRSTCLKQMALIMEETTRKYKEKQLKEQQEEAREWARKEVWNSSS